MYNLLRSIVYLQVLTAHPLLRSGEVAGGGDMVSLTERMLYSQLKAHPRVANLLVRQASAVSCKSSAHSQQMYEQPVSSHFPLHVTVYIILLPDHDGFFATGGAY